MDQTKQKEWLFHRDNSSDKKKLPMLLILLALFFSFLIINIKTPLMGEDLVLVPWGAGNKPEHIFEAFVRIAERIYEQSTGWNLRFGEQLSIVFAAFPKMVFNILNSGIVLIYIWLIYKYAFKRKMVFSFYTGMQILLCWFVIICIHPVLGEIFFWRTGSTNYLWGICLLLLFGMPLRYYIGNESVDIIGTSKIKIILLTITGFFAGFTNENTVVVFLLLYVGVIINNKLKRRSTPFWIFSSFFTFFAGSLYMYTSPSTKIRRDTYDRIFGIQEVSYKDYVARAENIIYRFFHDSRILVIFTIAIILLYFAVIFLNRTLPAVNKKKQIYECAENLFLLLLSSVSCGALIMSPYIETRSFLLPDFLMMVCILFYFEQIYLQLSQKAICSGVITVFCICCIGIEEVRILQKYDDYQQYAQRRFQAIEQMDEEEIFPWAEYQGPYFSRILTTREDYLMSENVRLDYYFGKNVVPWNHYIWEFDIEDSLEKVDMEGWLDTFAYDRPKDMIYLSGWAFRENNSIENEVYYVYLDCNGERYYFRTNRVEREDVADAYNNTMYLNCGFQQSIDSVSQILGESKLKNIRAGFCVVNREGGWFAEKGSDLLIP